MIRSIRARLLLALLVLAALVSLLAAGATYRRVLNETSDLFDYQLRQMALSLRGQVTLAPRIEVPPDQGDTDFVVQIWDLLGTRVYLSRPGLPLINQVVLGYTDLSLRGEKWRAYGLQTADGVIQIAQPIRVREQLAGAAALRVVIPLLMVLPILVVCVIGIVGRGLSPLRQVKAEVQQRDARSLTPLRSDNLPPEIEPLVGELNRLLERLQGAFSAQRAFIADAAHELRSPLTALRLQLQLLERAPDEAARLEARTRLGAAIERGIHLVEQLIALARSDPDEPVGHLAPVDLDAIVTAAVGDCRVVALARDIDIDLRVQPGMIVAGDAEALRTLVRNLVDNALRYTPPGGRVEVQATHSEGASVLVVCDTGPGIATPDRERVFDRFYRHPSVVEHGSGLGLAIVKAIAVRHRGTVTLGDAAGGGLKVTVTLPPISPAAAS